MLSCNSCARQLRQLVALLLEHLLDLVEELLELLVGHRERVLHALPAPA